MGAIFERFARSIVRMFYRISYLWIDWKYFYYSRLFAKCGSNLRFYGNCHIKNPHLISVGCDVTINDGAYLNGLGGLEIGNNTSISACSIIVSTSLDASSLREKRVHVNKKIIIGNNVQIGAGAIILSGVTIEDNVIVGAGCVVTGNKCLKANHIYVGNPVRTLRAIGA